MNEIEIKVINLLKINDEISSQAVKELLNIKKGKALTRKNFPNIRQYLHSFMNSYRPGMYRGGRCWVSVIEWKNGRKDFDRFLIRNNL